MSYLIFTGETFPWFDLTPNGRVQDDNDYIYEYINTKNYYEYENKDHYHYEFIIPGFSKDDIDIEIKDNKLEINGKIENNEVKYINKDIHFEVPLNKDVDIDNISAKYYPGVLVIIAPKKNITKKVKIL